MLSINLEKSIYHDIKFKNKDYNISVQDKGFFKFQNILILNKIQNFVYLFLILFILVIFLTSCETYHSAVSVDSRSRYKGKNKSIA